MERHGTPMRALEAALCGAAYQDVLRCCVARRRPSHEFVEAAVRKGFDGEWYGNNGEVSASCEKRYLKLRTCCLLWIKKFYSKSLQSSTDSAGYTTFHQETVNNAPIK
eukprot:652957-Amphidinium_carterae.1